MNELREEIAKKFIEALEQNKIPWQADWTCSSNVNITTGKKYTRLNQLWLSFVASEAGYRDNRWCTFLQAKENKWKVKPGSKGVRIEHFNYYDRKEKKHISCQEYNEIVKNEPERVYYYTKFHYVFNCSQIEGVPELEKINAELKTDDITQIRDKVITNLGLGFKEGGNQAYYSPKADEITMPAIESFRTEEGYISTFLHEAGHSTGHKSRLNRKLLNGFGTTEYAKEELRAEISSSFMAIEIGFGKIEEPSHLDNHKAYIQSWIENFKDKPQELFDAIKDAGKIADYVLNKGLGIMIEKEETLEVKETKEYCKKGRSR